MITQTAIAMAFPLIKLHENDPQMAGLHVGPVRLSIIPSSIQMMMEMNETLSRRTQRRGRKPNRSAEKTRSHQALRNASVLPQPQSNLMRLVTSVLYQMTICCLSAVMTSKIKITVMMTISPQAGIKLAGIENFFGTKSRWILMKTQ